MGKEKQELNPYSKPLPLSVDRIKRKIVFVSKRTKTKIHTKREKPKKVLCLQLLEFGECLYLYQLLIYLGEVYILFIFRKFEEMVK